jgi:bidirectional [NiFe] hydrogenase diaphorase subunit
MLELIMDGQVVRTKEGKTILEVARDEGIYIPTLCHHDGVSPSGACRLCIVEVYPQGSTVGYLTTSCNFPVEEGIEVWTGSERVLESRRLTAELLLAKEPESKAIQDIGAKLGVEKAPFVLERDHACILCTLCVRVCKEAVGVGALKLITRRGKTEPHIAASPETCIGCGACSLLCPTQFIKMEEVKDQRVIWDTAFKMKTCSQCGSYSTTEAHWAYMEERVGTSKEFRMARDICPVCRRDAMSSELLDLPGRLTVSLFQRG